AALGGTGGGSATGSLLRLGDQRWGELRQVLCRGVSPAGDGRPARAARNLPLEGLSGPTGAPAPVLAANGVARGSDPAGTGRRPVRAASVRRGTGPGGALSGHSRGARTGWGRHGAGLRGPRLGGAR